MTISTSQRNIEYKLGAYQNAGWQIVSREQVGGSRYRVVLSREAKYLNYVGIIGIIVFWSLLIGVFFI